MTIVYLLQVSPGEERIVTLLATLLAASQRNGTPEVMGIPRQEIKTARSGLPDNQKKRRF